MFLFIVNFKYGVFIKLIDLIVVVFWFFNVEFVVYVILLLFKIEIKVVKLIVVFFESFIKNNFWSCEELVMEYKIIRLFFWIVIVGGSVCIWMFWVKVEIIDRN